jgi:hypothetical protein
LRLSSPLMYVRRPHKWHAEFTLQVTWCARNTRTRPPQMKPVTAPVQSPTTSQPMSAGMAMPTATHKANVALIHRSVGDAARSFT